MLNRKCRRPGRLYLHIYLAILGIIFLFAALTALTFVAFKDDLDDDHKARAVSLITAALLPPADAPREELEKVLEHWQRQLDVDLTVTTAAGEIIAAAGTPIARRDDHANRKAWVRVRRGSLLAGVRLPDGRWAMVGHERPGGPHWIATLALLAVVVGVGAYPLARRITRRLERLRIGVDELGGGDLGARVKVEGRDEVAVLARSFNRAAQRIEALVRSQNSMLAGASHELRSPLTRIRMAVELLATEQRAALLEQVSNDIVELDELIDELLAASRFQVSSLQPSDLDTLDLLVVAAEASARVGAIVNGESTSFHGEERWLSRLLRNLLENARRHSGGDEVTVGLSRVDDVVTIIVEDNGEGVPEHLRERIFEPFYRPAGIREGRDRGVGVGLALVRQIAQRHGGGVVCEARDGGGCRFVVTLRDMYAGSA